MKETINRYTAMGYSFGEVSLAITALQDETENQEKVRPLSGWLEDSCKFQLWQAEPFCADNHTLCRLSPS